MERMTTATKIDIVKTCAHCGKEFHASHVQAKYCSEECRTAVQKEQNARAVAARKLRFKQSGGYSKCEVCGTPIYGYGRKCCSRKCYAERKKRAERPTKKAFPSLYEIEMAARERGLTYGQYMVLAREGKL